MKEISLHRRQQWLVFGEMLLASLLANSLPPLITTFQEQFGLSMAQSAFIPVIWTVGGVVANVIGAFFIARIGLRRYNFLYLLLICFTSLIFYLTNSAALLFTALFFYGFSLASGMAATSTILGQLPMRFRNFGMYHAFFGLGGIITPILISLIMAENLDYHIIFLLFIALSLLTSVFLWKARLLPDRKLEKTSFLESVSVLRSKIIQFCLLILILYAGCEMGIVLWSGNFFGTALSFSKETSALFLSGFWIAFTLSRFLAQSFEKMSGFIRTQFVLVSMLIAGIFLLIGAKIPFAFFLIAFGAAPIFPLTQKFALNHIPVQQMGMFNNILFGFLGIGNIIVPALMGLIGGINIVLAYLLPVLLMAVVLCILSKLQKEIEKAPA